MMTWYPVQMYEGMDERVWWGVCVYMYACVGVRACACTYICACVTWWCGVMYQCM